MKLVIEQETVKLSLTSCATSPQRHGCNFTSNSFWSELRLMKFFRDQEILILSLEMLIVSSCSQRLLAGGKETCTLALSESFQCLSADSAWNGEVTGIATHSGEWRKLVYKGHLGERAKGVGNSGARFYSAAFLSLQLLRFGRNGGGVLKMAVLEGDCEDSVSDSAKSCNSGSVIGILKWSWLTFHLCSKISKHD